MKPMKTIQTQALQAVGQWVSLLSTAVTPAKAHRRAQRADLARKRAQAALVRASQWVSPTVAVNLAESLFFTPAFYEAPPAEKAFLATGHKFKIRFKDRFLSAWSWPTEKAGPTVFLLHGWSGRGGQMHPFVQPLVNAGYSVVLFDAPAHGENFVAGDSETSQASMRDFADAISQAVVSHGPAHAIIAHSMGGPASLLAIAEGLKTEKLIMIGSPVSPFRYFDEVCKQLGLRERTQERLLRRMEKRLAIPWWELNVPKFARRIAGQLDLRVLIAHDEHDKEAPYADALVIQEAFSSTNSKQKAELVTTQGLGHRRILKDEKVIETVVEFVCRK
jgi:pimeloyl-ACP methyl ester carboxylesterase